MMGFCLPALLAALATVEAPLNGGVIIKSQEAVDLTPLTAVTNAIPWAATPMRADGDGGKWIRSGIKPYVLAGDRFASARRGVYAGADDLSAEVYLAADFDNLYIGIRLTDDAAPAPEQIDLAFTHHDVPLIQGWRDVGQRNFPDDVMFGFRVRDDGTLQTIVYKSQFRMDSGVLQLACGSETERRAQIDEGSGVQEKSGKIFACLKDGFVDIQVPWRTLQPLDPVVGTPFRMNLAVYDCDGEGAKKESVVAFAPGLVDVFSGYHFPVFTMPVPPPAVKYALGASLPERNYLLKDLPFAVSVRTAEAFEGKVDLLSVDGTAEELVQSYPVRSERGKPLTLTLKIPSEQLTEGDSRRFSVRLVDADGRMVATAPVVAPTKDNGVTIFHRDSIVKLIDVLRDDADSYRRTVATLEERGLDTVYPRAWLAMMDMFVESSREDLKRDPPRVISNTKYLKETIYPKAVAYAERVLRDPSRQWIVPHGDPMKMTMKDGYFWNEDGKPEFFWGPCLFWYLRKDAHYTWELGFNSIVPELPDSTQPSVELERQAYMKEMAARKIRMNAPVRIPDLQLTGADARRSKLLQEHPDVKNLDPNNFMPFIVQHPAIGKVIDEGVKESVAFNNRYPGLCSFWLWNEPWYTNYSEMTRQDFIKRLKQRYGNRIDLLNKRWKSAYKNFEEIQLIQWPDPGNYAPWYDFQTFRDELLNTFFSTLHLRSRQYRPDMPTHVKFMSQSLASFDIERFQEPYEIIGRDGNGSDRDNLYLDLFRSVAPEKPIIDTEVHIWYGGDAIVNGVAWDLALHGLADGNWWCWHSNPRFSDSIRNAQSMNALVMSGLDIRRLFADYIHPVAQDRAPYATFFQPMIERRTDVKVLRMRYEVSGSAYSLGYRPFYVTERTIGKQALDKEKYLFAAESMYVNEATFSRIREWVKKGGTLLTVRNGFNANEYGEPRNTESLIPAKNGEAYGENLTVYRQGEGRVITIDNLALLPDPVKDGGQCLGGGGGEEMEARRQIYRKALACFLEKEGLVKDVVIRQTGPGAESDQMMRYDWRATEIAPKVWSVIVRNAGINRSIPAEIAAKHPIKRIVDMVDDVVLYEQPSKMNPFNWGAANPTAFTLPYTDFTKVYRVELE